MEGAQLLVSDSAESGCPAVVSDGPAEYPPSTEADEDGSEYPDITLLLHTLAPLEASYHVEKMVE